MTKHTDTHAHRNSCESECVCLPPIDKVGSEYKCEPAPKEPGTRPAIGHNRLTHYLLHPEAIDAKQSSMLYQIPKRMGGPLKPPPDKEMIGWGLHLQEGWHWNTIWILLAMVAFPSLLFGIVWSVAQKDIQGGFTISGYMISLGSLGVGYLGVRDMRY